MSDRFVGIVCGLRSERRCLEHAGLGGRIRTAVAGASSSRAEALAFDLVRAGAAGLVSFGVAGGLAEVARTGDLVIVTRVVGPHGEEWPVHDTWRTRLLEAAAQRSITHAEGALLGADEVLATPEVKSAAHERTGAVAVDMESHGVARAAAATVVPFLVIRAIADTAARTIPPAALSAVDRNGRVRPLAVAASAFARPGDTPELMRLRRDSAAAHAMLRRVARDLFPAWLSRLQIVERLPDQ